MHSAYWQPVVDDLQKDFRVHCIDLPGHGHSDYQGEQQLPAFIERIMQTVDNTTTKPFSLIGWSLGGLLSQQLVHEFPGRVNNLVLIASSPSFVQREAWQHATSESILNGFADSLLRDYRATLNRFLAIQVLGSDKQKQELIKLKERLYSRGDPDPIALQAGLTLLQSVDLRDQLSAINIPVMLLGGERDTLVPITALQAMAEQLAESETHIIKGAGHAPFISHQNEVIQHCRAFLLS